MMEEDIDLEDLEWRLYSQIYHSSGTNEENSTVCENTISQVSSVSGHQKKSFRYYEKRTPQVTSSSEAQTYISLGRNGRPGLLEDTGTSKVQNDFTFDSNSATVVTNYDTNQFHNNITVNQFTVPVILHPDGVLSSQPEKYFSPWSSETLKLITSKRNKKKPKKKKNKPRLEEIKKHNIVERKGQTNEITIWLSDDSDDCVIVENINNNKPNKINTGFPKKYNESEGGEKPESDDDIIYIPPPPIEVIDIEANEIEQTSLVTLDDKSSSSDDISKDSNEEILKKSNKPEENEDSLKSPESATSNDFLENTSTENVSTNFNFSLHGSDFNNSQGDFVQPPKKPVEYCETESSCSTNEQSRSFSNTVKTIVFDEVEFPKEDIFSDKNLESFSSFITPKRNSKLSQEILVSQSSKANDEKIQNCDTSSDGTSSESDYDNCSKTENLKIPEDDPKYKNLPNLSPMLPAVDETPRKSLQKKKARQFSQNSSKVGLDRKSNMVEDLFDPMVETIDLIKTRSKRKKKIPQRISINSEDIEPDHFSQINDEEEKSIASEKQNNKKRKSVSSENLQILCDAVPEKSRKKKKRGISTEDEILLTEVENTNNSESMSIKHQLIANFEEIGETVGTITTAMIDSETCQNNENIEDLEELNFIEDSVASDRQKTKLLISISQNLLIASGDEVLKNVPEKLKSEKPLEIEKGEDAKTPTTENTTDMEKLKDNMKSPEIIQNCSRTERNEMEHEENHTLNLTVIDDTEITSDVEVITSSDSDSDFQISEAAGGDITLANCFSPAQSINKSEPSLKNSCNGKNLQKIVTFEEFDVDKIHKNQSDNPEKWQISYRDRAIYLNMDINRGPRCNRCRHFGHTSLRCSEKPEPPSCFLCGEPNHREPRCPNKRCTQCGNQGDFSTSYCWKCFKFRHTTCRLCKMKGHIESTCPDLWRRYHSTTDDGPIVVSRAQVKPRNQQWCSGCARQGHLEHECNYNREYPPTTPYIMNYEDNLAKNKDRLPQLLIANQESVEGAPRNLEDSIPNLPYGQSSPVGHSTAISPLMSIQLGLPDQLPTYDQLTQPNQVLVPDQLPIHNQLPAPNQLAYLNQVLNPIQLQIFSQLPVLNQLQTLSIIQSQNVVLNPVNPNFTNDIPNRVLNPCSISNTARSSSTVNFDNKYYLSNSNNINLIDEKGIKQIILFMPFSAVNDFLAKEMVELENNNVHPRLLKSKLFRYDKMLKDKKPLPIKLQREKCYWFRILNMFIFGKHRFGDGRLHVNYLRKYLADSKSDQLDDHKRRSLLSSYSYIFTYEKHKNVNYYKWIKILIQKYEEGKK